MKTFNPMRSLIQLLVPAPLEEAQTGSTVRWGALIASSVLVCLPLASATAAESVSDPASFTFWNMVIAVFVITVAASVAYLCYGAARLWAGYWRILAVTPLLILTMWTALAITTTLGSDSLRPLWPFELLLWAMATTIYLVTLFTARRAFEKAEAKTGGS